MLLAPGIVRICLKCSAPLGELSGLHTGVSFTRAPHKMAVVLLAGINEGYQLQRRLMAGSGPVKIMKRTPEVTSWLSRN